MSVDMTKLIGRINELSAKRKSAEGLTEAEAAERKELHKQYLSVLRGNIAAQLDNIEVVEESKEQPGEYKTIWEGKNVKAQDSNIN